MTSLFMLDTNSVSYALRGHGQVAANIVRRRPSELCNSAITLAELRFGAERRKSAKLQELIEAFTAPRRNSEDWARISPRAGRRSESSTS